MSEDKKRRRFAELTVCAALAAVVVGLPATSAFADTSTKTTGGPIKTADGWNRPEEPGLKSEGTVPLGARDVAEMILGFSTSIKSWITNTISGWLAKDGPVSAGEGGGDGTLVAQADGDTEEEEVVTDEEDQSDEEGSDDGDDPGDDDPPPPSCDLCATVYPNPDGGGDGSPYSEHVDPNSLVENPYDRLEMPTDDGTGPWGPASYGTAVTSIGQVAQLAY